MLPDKTRIEFDAEIERLTEEIEEWAEIEAEAEYGTPTARQAAAEGRERERYREGVGLAAEYWECDSVVLQPLTDGLRRAVGDLVEDTAYDRDQCLVAVGTVEAPYVEHDPDAITQDTLQETVANIPDLAPQYVDWCADRVTDLGRLGDEMGKSSRRLVLEKRQAQTSPETSG